MCPAVVNRRSERSGLVLRNETELPTTQAPVACSKLSPGRQRRRRGRASFLQMPLWDSNIDRRAARSAPPLLTAELHEIVGGG